MTNEEQLATDVVNTITGMDETTRDLEAMRQASIKAKPEMYESFVAKLARIETNICNMPYRIAVQMLPAFKRMKVAVEGIRPDSL